MNYRAKIQNIKAAYLVGDITLEEAEGYVESLLEEMNKKGLKLAKKMGRKYKKLTFNQVFR